MLVLRLLVMVLTIICLMDGHAEVSSSTTGIRNRRESPATKTNDSEVEVLDRKKKKKPKPSKKKKPKPGKKKPKPNKAKPKPTKPVTTTTTMSTSTLKTTTILTTPTITTTATTTTTTVSPTTTETTVKTITSTASATTTLSTTTSATTTTVATSSTASTTTTTIPTTATTSSLPTTAATIADSGAGGECKATNGKPCIFPFKDGKEYNECKNEGGKYFWCATSVYDSGKYKHWSYCSTDGPCPLEGDDEECKATNNKPCVFPFKDGNKEYNECADHGGKYFWCATGTNSAGKYTAWSECPKDGSCPLPQKSTTPAMTSTATSAASTTPLTTGASMTPAEIENKVVNSLKDLVKEESKDGTLEMIESINKITQTIIEDLKGKSEDNEVKSLQSNHTFEGWNPPSQKLTVGYKQDGDLIEIREYGEESELLWSTVWYLGDVYKLKESTCCIACRTYYPEASYFDYYEKLNKCWCYMKIPDVEPQTIYHKTYSSGKCGSSPACSISKQDKIKSVRASSTMLHMIPPSIHYDTYDIRHPRTQILLMLRTYALACMKYRSEGKLTTSTGDLDETNEDFQMGFFAFAPHVFLLTPTGQVKFIRATFSTVPAASLGETQITDIHYQRCNAYYRHIIDTKFSKPKRKQEDTEVVLFPMLKAYLNRAPYNDLATEVFFYTTYNPCIQQGTATPTDSKSQGCTRRTFQLVSELNSGRSPDDRVSMHVGFNLWFKAAHQSKRSIMSTRNRVNCPEAQANFCRKIDHLKTEFCITNDDQLSFTKLKLQEAEKCQDSKFTPPSGFDC